jgi:two-component system nitrate/nitrite sensor histidine kinase NarX
MLETGEPFILPDLQQLGLSFDFSEAPWARGMLFAPIRLLHETPGFVALVSEQPDYFTPEMAARLMALANQAAVTLRNAQLYEQAQEAAALEERQRLARDLHDAVSQTLFSASITAQMLPRLWDRGEEKVRDGLDTLVALTQGAQAEMRMLLLELRPQAFKDTPMSDLIKHLAQAHTAKTGVPVALHLAPVPPLSPVQKQAVYRIIQEALNNSMKHAQAQHVAINLLEDAEQVQLEIIDDGKGFNKDAVLPGRLGLSIMQERANSIAVELDISSAVSKGTKITLIWPR